MMTIPSMWMIAQAVLFAFGLYWCGHMAGKVRQHVHDFRTAGDASHRLAIALVWLFTLLVAGYCARFLWFLGGLVVAGFG